MFIMVLNHTTSFAVQDVTEPPPKQREQEAVYKKVLYVSDVRLVLINVVNVSMFACFVGLAEAFSP